MSVPGGGTPAAARPTSPDGSAAAGEQPTDALADRFRLLAVHDFAGYSPTYERIAVALAEDPASLELLLDVAPTGRTPILALAAVHDLVLAEPTLELAAVYDGRSAADPWPTFRALLHQRHDDVVARMRSRAIQTNEVGRSAALLPALATVAQGAAADGDDRPLAVVEVGASAGLNLRFDRYAVSYLRDGAVVAAGGVPSSPVRVECELRGPADPPSTVGPAIASRVGLDLAPIDVTDPADARWLRACLWPGVPDRPERLAAALAAAQADPPEVRAGDATTDLAPLLGELPDDVLPVVVGTWALAYLGRGGRADLLAALDEVGDRRDLALVTAEVPSVTPWLPEVPADVAAHGGPTADGTVLGLRTWRAGSTSDEVLALCHPHLRWMAWAPGAGGPR